MSAVTYRRYLPLLLTTACGLFLIGDYFIDVPGADVPATFARDTSVISTAVGVLVANIVLTRWQIRKAQDAKTFYDRLIPYISLIVFGAYIIVGLGIGTESDIYDTLTEYTYRGLRLGTGTTLFWELYAAYRAWRIRTVEGAALLVAALLVFIGLSPWAYIYIHPGMADVSKWILDQVTSPAYVALIIGGGLGGAVAAIRTLIWREKSYMREVA
jgi:hypothetical protein